MVRSIRIFSIIIPFILILILCGCTKEEQLKEANTIIDEQSEGLNDAATKVLLLTQKNEDLINRTKELELEKEYLFEVIEGDRFIITQLEKNMNNTDNLNLVQFEGGSINLSSNHDIFLEYPTHSVVTSNHINVKLLTKVSQLVFDVYDMKGNLLNQPVSVSTNEETWNQNWRIIDETIFFYGRPETDQGIIKIYSDDNNYVQIPIIFNYPLEVETYIDLIEPKESYIVEDNVSLIGYASVWEGTVVYRIKDLLGNVLTHGAIQATNAAPDTGIFAIDVPLEIPSQQIIIEVFEESAKDGDEINKVSATVNYINKKMK